VEKYCRAKQATDNNIILCMRFARWVTKATDYVILIAFPRQQWLHERASVLRLYVHYLSCWLLKALLKYTDTVSSSGKTLGSGQSILYGGNTCEPPVTTAELSSRESNSWNKRRISDRQIQN
jgi:hypothetical protein